MAKKKEKEKTYGDKFKEWWGSDTAKAVATIIAVLLIPVAVLAWNYASSTEVEYENNILEGQATISADLEDVSVDITQEGEEVEEYLETEPIELEGELNQPTIDQPDQLDSLKDQVALNDQETEEEDKGGNFLRKLLAGSIVISNITSNDDVKENDSVSTNADEIGNLFKGEETVVAEESNYIDQTSEMELENESNKDEDSSMSIEEFLSGLTKKDDNKEDSDSSEDVDTQESDQTIAANETVENVEEISEINNVTTLPETSSNKEYIVENGDSIYSISLKLCGDESYYIDNMYSNYLKVGQTIIVECR